MFKKELTSLLDRMNEGESEEFHKNLVIDFFKKTYYDPGHFVNTKGRNDLVIHNGNSAGTSVGVIVETKKPTNRVEMVSRNNLNAKALQELVLYYLRERITYNNLEVKHLVITNIYEWFVFDATVFERLFAQNKSLVQQFKDFEGGRLAGTTTDFFYSQIAQPAIEKIEGEVEFAYFDIRDYEKPLRNIDLKDDVKLIALFKLLSPEHLLKLPFANDSNNLDKSFYAELLHIIGLTETKAGGKKIIERNPKGRRHSGSILEDAIIQLDSLDKINRLDRPGQYGENYEERLFNVGLQLAITWINRILFLKLLEAQLQVYHKGNPKYQFLNTDKIQNFDDLNSLFFQVLAKKYEDRNEDVRKVFEHVPYLNSSLFEPTEMEHQTLFISNLRDEKVLLILSQTVLKDEKGKRRTGELTTLEYLFEFLNAYDFSSEGSEAIQEDNKSLIKENGVMIYITSNKWMRAGYGKSTRRFFADKTNPLILIDFGGIQIFDSATVDTNILMFSKSENKEETLACVIRDKEIQDLDVYFKEHASKISFKTDDSWVVLSEIEQRIKAKIEAVGTPLKEWDIKIYRGILTGYNEAFIIDGKNVKNSLRKIQNLPRL